MTANKIAGALVMTLAELFEELERREVRGSSKSSGWVDGEDSPADCHGNEDICSQEHSDILLGNLKETLSSYLSVG